MLPSWLSYDNIVGHRRFLCANPACQSVHDGRNVYSLLANITTILFLAASLADSQWFSISGTTHCSLNYIGMTMFYQPTVITYIETNDILAPGDIETRQHIQLTVGRHKYTDCINRPGVHLFHLQMFVQFLAVSVNIIALVLEVLGPKIKSDFLKWTQSHSLMNIVSVLFITLCMGISYWITCNLELTLRKHSTKPDTVDVEFSIGFYLIVGAGFTSLFSVISGLFQNSHYLKLRSDGRPLIGAEQMNESDSELAGRRAIPGSTGPPPPLHMIINNPPPPAYAP